MNFADDQSGWKFLPEMSTPRKGAFAWADSVSGRIYVAGGISAEGGQPLNSVEVLDINESTPAWAPASKLIFNHIY